MQFFNEDSKIFLINLNNDTSKIYNIKLNNLNYLKIYNL